MRHIIANPYVETDMTKHFVCKLYREDHNNVEIRNNGLDPYETWRGLLAWGMYVHPLSEGDPFKDTNDSLNLLSIIML
jgi:hypothetical protein